MFSLIMSYLVLSAGLTSWAVTLYKGDIATIKKSNLISWFLFGPLVMVALFPFVIGAVCFKKWEALK